MTTCKVFLILFLLLILMSLGFGQKIREIELPSFAASCPYTDTLNRESLDCSRFIEWGLRGSIYNQGKNNENLLKYSNKFQWLCSWDGEVSFKNVLKDYMIGSTWSTYIFYILMDHDGWEHQRNILTVWGRSNGDSIEFKSAQYGPFNTGLGVERVQGVKRFPDNSILLMVFRGGEGSDSYKFLRGTAFNNFEEFYSVGWYNGGDEGPVSRCEYSYTFDDIDNYHYYKCAEFARFFNVDSTGRESLDSTKCRTIDLWEMVKDYYNIDKDTSNIKQINNTDEKW
jgi:hypothetical protein